MTQIFNQIPTNEQFIIAVKTIFKEYTPGIYTNDDGWTLKSEPTTDGSNLMCMLLRDPAGEPFESAYFLDNFEKAYGFEFHHYEKRTGRTGKTHLNQKFSPYHFPQGTVVEISKEVAFRNYEKPDEPIRKQFTVDYVRQNGPRTYILVMEGDYPWDGKEDGEDEPRTAMYDMGHIVRIVTPGKGPLKIEHSITVAPVSMYATHVAQWREETKRLARDWSREIGRVKKHEVVARTYDHVVLETLIDIGLHADNQGKWLDEEKLDTLMKTTGIGRPVKLGKFTPSWMNSVSTEPAFVVIDLKKLRAWLTKNQHRIFHTLTYTHLENRRQIDEAWGRIGDEVDYFSSTAEEVTSS